jgi:hypothetical protein
MPASCCELFVVGGGRGGVGEEILAQLSPQSIQAQVENNCLAVVADCKQFLFPRNSLNDVEQNARGKRTRECVWL